MGLGFLRHLADGRVDGFSAGSEPATAVNPVAVLAMHERGIDIASASPARWDEAMLVAADIVVTMGCGDTCPIIPGKRYEDWDLDDPAGQPIEVVRNVRDDIERRVRNLLTDLGVELS